MEPMWEPPAKPFCVQVKDPEKKSKFKGIKTFTAYNVIPDVSVPLRLRCMYTCSVYTKAKR